MMRSMISLFVMCVASFAMAADRPPQYVILAFDGSKDTGFWNESREFAAENGNKFTYFVSGVYFMSDSDAKSNKQDANKKIIGYVEPSHGLGKSNIGFGGPAANIPPRLAHMAAAMAEGHEMASHANGHFDGSAYSQDQWESEFEQFERFMSQAWEKYAPNDEPAGWNEYFQSEVTGFRAPLLGIGSTGNKLYAALNTYNFEYDTSRIDKMEFWPNKINGIWNMPLAGVTYVNENGTTKKTISMDYNFYFSQTGGVKGKDSTLFPKYQSQMYKSYMGYFVKNYYGNRAPIHIGHHFSKWNGGAYWEAMKQFAREVCSKPEVVCGTYKDLVSFLNTNEANIADFKAAKFDNGKMPAPQGLAPLLPVGNIDEAEMKLLQAIGSEHFNAHADEGD